MNTTRWLIGFLAAVVATPVVTQSQSAIASASGRTPWFDEPCLADSVDDFEWTRYDLHGVRIRVPREARPVPVPGGDELKFRKGQATLRLRLHRDAHGLFREFRRPEYVHRSCLGDIGGIMAEAISIRRRGEGFAATWADAENGEYLTAVVEGSRLADVTFLRRSLFTLQFPGERRR
jgi:hypothetical protein